MEVILVTGANRGIGLALTRALLAKGDIVIAGCRRPDESSELTQLTLLHPETIDLVKCDVDCEEVLAEAAEASLQRRKILDVIVNNAGIMPEAGNESILNIELNLLRQAFDTNVLGAVRVIRAFYTMLAQSRAAARRQYLFRPRLDFNKGEPRLLRLLDLKSCVEYVDSVFC